MAARKGEPPFEAFGHLKQRATARRGMTMAYTGPVWPAKVAERHSGDQ
jgi:hypothetical protein